jgi:hypothetical protein
MSASAGSLTPNGNTTILSEKNTANYIGIASPATNERGILFPEPGVPEAGGIIFNNASTPDGFQFRTGGNFTTMVLQSGGNLGLGVTNPTRIFQVVQNSATDPQADAWTTYSSRRWKRDIVPIAGSLELVGRLEGVRYFWKESGKADIGLIAEDVGRVLPEIVQFDEDGINAESIDYARIVAVLIEAVKEQQRQIDQLQKKIKEIERLP